MRSQFYIQLLNTSRLY